ALVRLSLCLDPDLGGKNGIHRRLGYGLLHLSRGLLSAFAAICLGVTSADWHRRRPTRDTLWSTPGNRADFVPVRGELPWRPRRRWGAGGRHGPQTGIDRRVDPCRTDLREGFRNQLPNRHARHTGGCGRLL